MKSKDLNTQAAEIVMGWRNYADFWWEDADGKCTFLMYDDDGPYWSPTTDRSHAHMVLKRVEELGLADAFIHRLIKVHFQQEPLNLCWWLHTVDPAISVLTAVEVVKEFRTKQEKENKNEMETN